MLSSTSAKISLLFIGVFLCFSFTNPEVKKPKKRKSSKTIINKIEQNLLSGWTISHIDDNQEKFSEQMKTLGFTYGLTLINEHLPIILKTKEGDKKKYPELKIIVSTLDKKKTMKSFVSQKSKSSAFRHCFIESRKYLLTVVWTECNIEYINKDGQNELIDFGGSTKYEKSRRKFIKQLNWYFEMY
ncbi:MAG: hypothetical protein AB8G11_09905 [Saprospiraceae bacterium]